MKEMTVFDCQDMPEELRQRFYEETGHYGDDVYVDWHINDTIDPSDDKKVVDAWLVEQGMDAGGEDREGAHVLIKRWW